MEYDQRVPELTFDLKTDAMGDYSLVLSKYTRLDDNIVLTNSFSTARGVHAEFAKLERMISNAKGDAFKRVNRDASPNTVKGEETAPPTGPSARR